MVEELPSIGFEEFVRLEQDSPRRHEFVGGRVYVMAGGTERHDLAAGLTYERLAPGARRQGCRAFTANRLLRAGDATYYPDVFVVCGRAANRLYETDATVVVEVLSPSTADVDRREKLAAYRQLPSLELYVLLDPQSPRLEVVHLTRDGQLRWEVFGPGSVLPTRCGDLDIDDVYATLDRSATT